jgi:hypothetical protein
LAILNEKITQVVAIDVIPDAIILEQSANIGSHLAPNEKSTFQAFLIFLSDRLDA